MPAGFTRWPMWRRWFGHRSERAAGRYLRGKGLRVLAYNLGELVGEIDLLARDGDTLVVVEVRSSESAPLHETAATVNFPKQRKLTDAAVRFLQRHRLLGVNLRFDVLSVRWPPGGEPEFLYIPNAFEAVGKFQFWN